MANMKRFGLWSLILSLLMAIGLVGCSANGGGVSGAPDQATTQPVGITKYASDINFLTKMATSAALSKAKLAPDKLANIDSYLSAAYDLLAVPGKPNFDGARALALKKLPEGQRFIGLAVVDVVERYLPQYAAKFADKTKAYQTLVGAALSGAKEAVAQYSASTSADTAVGLRGT